MNNLYIHQLETEIKQLREVLRINHQIIDMYEEKIDKALNYTKGFINGETSRIDEWKNVELVLETIVEILGDKENESS